jgi:hypothetical protein
VGVRPWAPATSVRRGRETRRTASGEWARVLDLFGCRPGGHSWWASGCFTLGGLGPVPLCGPAG